MRAMLGLEEQALLADGRRPEACKGEWQPREVGWAPTAVILPWDGAVDGT